MGRYPYFSLAESAVLGDARMFQKKRGVRAGWPDVMAHFRVRAIYLETTSPSLHEEQLPQDRGMGIHRHVVHAAVASDGAGAGQLAGDLCQSARGTTAGSQA